MSAGSWAGKEFISTGLISAQCESLYCKLPSVVVSLISTFSALTFTVSAPLAHGVEQTRLRSRYCRWDKSFLNKVVT